VSLVGDILGTIAIDGPPVSVTIPTPGPDARFTVTATAGQRVKVTVTNVTNPLAYVILVDPDGTSQATLPINNNPAGQTFSIDVQTLGMSGTYQLWVQHYNSTDVGRETLQITSVPDVTAPITIGGPSVTVTTTLVGQDARLNFTAAAGQLIFVTITNVSNPYAYVWLVIPGRATHGSYVQISNQCQAGRLTWIPRPCRGPGPTRYGYSTFNPMWGARPSRSRAYL
jgi:hypothetical protein